MKGVAVSGRQAQTVSGAHRTPGNLAPCLGYRVALKASRAGDHFPCRSAGRLGRELLVASPEGCGGHCPDPSAPTGRSSPLPAWWAGTPHHPTCLGISTPGLCCHLPGLGQPRVTSEPLLSL